jgi:1-aminocyclopropane-1-carboxylate deaminase/D-cysteine desulfhydrase-like pyridoxal-dependent ACC family enzyme
MTLPTPQDLTRLAARLTPWELHKGIWFKREDKFAPLGYGGLSGSKLRQLIHLFEKYRGNATQVVTGASVRSPQHSMTAFLAAVYGMKSLNVVGATSPATLFNYPNPAIAAGFGAEFDFIKVAYNPALQRRVEELRHQFENEGEEQAFVVPYGITLDHVKNTAEDVTAFHEVGAVQTENIPDEVHTLIVPAGSCNSLTSVMLGLARNPHNLRKLVSIGIGPDKLAWTKSRLRVMGVDPENLPFDWNYKISLHDSGYASYSDLMPETYDDIVFHPTYEGKMIRWLREQGSLDNPEGLGFWIVGADTDPAVCRPYFTT